jgi:hypothetical protein
MPLTPLLFGRGSRQAVWLVADPVAAVWRAASDAEAIKRAAVEHDAATCGDCAAGCWYCEECGEHHAEVESERTGD